MELRDLRTFVAVATTGGFGRAADQLHLAQPVVSQHVKRLERELGALLFHRTTRRVELTPAGEQLFERARSILAEVDRAGEEVRQVQAGGIGKVSVGFVGTATYSLLPIIARQVRAQLPRIELDLLGERLSPGLADDLVERRLDLAVMREPGPDLAITALPLRSERLVAVLPADHRLAARAASLSVADLLDEVFVTHPSGRRSVVYAAVLAACRTAGFAPREIIEVAETATLVNFVAAGLGVAIVPEPVRALALAGVMYVELTDRPPPLDLLLAYRSQEKLSAAVAAVAGIIETTVRATT